MCERYYINTELRIISRNINNYFINYGNRKKVDKAYLTYEEIIDGGVLKINLSKVPEKSF